MNLNALAMFVLVAGAGLVTGIASVAFGCASLKARDAVDGIGGMLACILTLTLATVCVIACIDLWPSIWIGGAQ